MITTRVEFMCKGVKGEWVAAEIGYIENSFCEG
jgi:hypothetical protein